jgi:hypothetical protein
VPFDPARVPLADLLAALLERVREASPVSGRVQEVEHVLNPRVRARAQHARCALPPLRQPAAANLGPKLVE